MGQKNRINKQGGKISRASRADNNKVLLVYHHVILPSKQDRINEQVDMSEQGRRKKLKSNK